MEHSMRKSVTFFLIFTLCQILNAANTAELYVVAKSGLLLRAEPSQKGKVIELIPFKSKVNVIETTGPSVRIERITAPWYKVSWKGNEGWVFSGFLKSAARHEDNILLRPSFSNSILTHLPKNLEGRYNKNDMRIDLADFSAVPDIIFDNLVVIDKDTVYLDSIAELVYNRDDCDDSNNNFILKSGKKYNWIDNPVFFRKSYYDTLSNNLPVIMKLWSIKDKELAEIFYRAIEKEIIEFADSFDPDLTDTKQRIDHVRNKCDLKIYDISEKGYKSYLMILESKKDSGYDYRQFCFVSNGKIIDHIYFGRYKNSFTINDTMYFYMSYWSESSVLVLFTFKNGVLKKVEEITVGC